MVMLLLGCGGNADNDIPDNGGPTSETDSSQPSGEDASGSESAAGNADLGGFSVMEVPDGVVYVGYADASQAILEYPVDDFDRIVANFDDFTSNAGVYQRQEADSGGVIYTKTLAPESDGDFINIIVTPKSVSSDLDDDGEVTFVTISRTAR